VSVATIAKQTGIVGGGGVGPSQTTSVRDREKLSLDFRETLAKASMPDAAPATALGENGAAALAGLKFSAHAVDRMKSRGISFSPDAMKGIENAVSRAASKGSRDTLVLTGDNALIVSVKNNTVVTVMDRAAMRENVFTNIDSTVVV
jgi:flagellar operon protein